MTLYTINNINHTATQIPVLMRTHNLLVFAREHKNGNTKDSRNPAQRDFKAIASYITVETCAGTEM